MAALYLTDGAFWLSLLTAALASVRAGRGPARLALAGALFVGLLAPVLPVRSVVSFGVSLLGVGLVYALRPYASALPLLALPLLSPFARYLDAVVGFEWRLGLSAAAGEVFGVWGREVSVDGTSILLDGRAFGVDAACAGLHMLLTGLATALLLAAVTEWRTRRVWRWWVALGILAAALALTLVSNLARILVLVERGWGAGHPLHEPVGLACFAAYVLLPLAAGVTWLGRQSWATAAPSSATRSELRRVGWRVAGVALGVACLAFAKTRQPAAVSPGDGAVALYGQVPERRAHDVLAYRFADALVFRKPIGAFYHAEHSPLICWRGSGYEIAEVSLREAGDGGHYYVGTLRRGGERLHTAWWMSNGERATVDQLTWRADMAQGAPAYALVNVTASSAAALACWVGELRGE